MLLMFRDRTHGLCRTKVRKSETAFALGLILDYAHGNNHHKFAELVVSKAKQFYLGDKNCPLAYEPSGEDFRSPCLGEADLMRRVLPNQEFARWLRIFMPQIPTGDCKWLQPVVSPDPSDPKLAHLDGLNLSRAWMLEGIAAGLPKADKRPNSGWITFQMRSEKDLSHALWLMRLSYLRYALKISTDPQKLFE
jgi:Protein of unknown function (DUF2891)/Family of unknown function (DUF5519)